MSKITIPDVAGKELFNFLVTNKTLLIAEKKFEVKRGDGVMYLPKYEGKPSVTKADGIASNPTVLSVTSIINTTNWLDSHNDLHIPGIWDKSLKETKSFYLLEEHKLSFRGIISDEVKAYVKTVSWKSLGYDLPGNTQALIFESTVRKSRNEYMFAQYRDNHVKNHSVGMRYFDIVLCINDEDYGAEFEAWNKYYPMVANKSAADDREWMWVVKQAGCIEGSAVPIGSNTATPTTSVQAGPEKSTRKNKEPQKALMKELNNLLTITKLS